MQTALVNLMMAATAEKRGMPITWKMSDKQRGLQRNRDNN